MNKYFRFFIAFSLSLVFHTIFLFNFNLFSLEDARTFSKDSGESKVKIILKYRERKKQKNSSKKIVEKTKVAEKVEGREKKVIADKKDSSSSGESSKIAEYLSIVRSKINENLYISRVAARMNLTGSVKIRFNIFSPNIIRDLKVIKSSSYKALDRSALQTVRSMDSIPVIPKGIKLSIIPVDATVIYE